MSATALLVFARCAGFAFRAPGFSHPSVPASVRAALALLLTIVLTPSVRAPAHVSDAALLAALGVEFLIGSAIGLGASVVYDGAYAGGRAIDDYIGVKAIAPTVQLVAPSGFGRVWSLAYTGGFFLSGAYRITIAAFARGFERLPPATFGSAPAWTSFAAAVATDIVAVAIAVAGPSIALAFVVQIALGALSRAVPRFGSFTLAFPLTFGAALMMTALGAPALTGAALAPIVTVPGRP